MKQIINKTETNSKTIAQAAQNLTGLGFKLYIYFSQYPLNKKASFPTSHFEIEYGMHRTSRIRAFNNLLDYKYLVDIGNDTYEFWATPQAEI